jgi:hypothetical protein
VTDRELLEAAARAAGMRIECLAEIVAAPGHFAGGFSVFNDKGGSQLWNPLTDDGDALRLAAKLGIDVEWWRSMPQGIGGRVSFDGNGIILMENVSDKAMMLRKAIVRAAAAMAG